MAAAFRFTRLDIYNISVEVSQELFDLADRIEGLKKFRFAQQLDGATLSITNNIAEGSGATSDIEFARFLEMVRKSVYECANILLILERRGLVNTEERRSLYTKLLDLSVRIHNFRMSLKK